MPRHREKNQQSSKSWLTIGIVGIVFHSEIMFYILFFQISLVGENARAALGGQYRRLGAD
jgi:hypothetical protein